MAVQNPGGNSGFHIKKAGNYGWLSLGITNSKKKALQPFNPHIPTYPRNRSNSPVKNSFWSVKSPQLYYQPPTIPKMPPPKKKGSNPQPTKCWSWKLPNFTPNLQPLQPHQPHQPHQPQPPLFSICARRCGDRATWSHSGSAWPQRARRDVACGLSASSEASASASTAWRGDGEALGGWSRGGRTWNAPLKLLWLKKRKHV